MAIEQTPIHDTREYREFITLARQEIPTMFNLGVKHMNVAIPDSIVARVIKAVDTAMVYDIFKQKVSSSLEDVCIVDEWFKGKDHRDRDIIRFVACKEILRDEV